MPRPSREVDSSASHAALFAAELQAARIAKGLTQDELGDLPSYSQSQISQIEAGTRTPSLKFAEDCDRLLGTTGTLARIWPFLKKSEALPIWFRGYVELEATAKKIQAFEVQTVPGLLQSERYMRSMFDAYAPVDLDTEAVIAARIERQQLLSKPDAPSLWVVLDESVLHRPLGGTEVMREQLNALLDLDSRRIVVQVLPYRAGAHALMDGSMNILSFVGRSEAVYLEPAGNSHLITQIEEVEKYRHRYDLVRAAALSQDESAALIRKTAKEF